MKLLISIILFLIASPAYCDQPPIKIGAVLHLTGDLAMTSNAFREGIELGTSLLNAQPEGPKYELLVEDGMNTTKTSYTASQKLISVDKVNVAILESFFDVGADGPLFEKAKTPVICIWDSNPELEAMGNYIFAIGPWTPSSGELASQFALDKLGARSGVVIYHADKWSESVKNYFKSDFERHGGKILQEVSINPDETDFRAIFTRIISLNPDFLYSPVTFNLVPFYSQLKKFKFSKPIISSDIIDHYHIEESPSSFEGIYQTNLKKPSSGEYQKMAAAYEIKYSHPVSMPWFTAVGYDAIMAIDIAARSSGHSGEEITKGLYQVKNYQGASSEITINDKGTSPQIEVMYRIKDGKFVEIP